MPHFLNGKLGQTPHRITDAIMSREVPSLPRDTQQPAGTTPRPAGPLPVLCQGATLSPTPCCPGDREVALCLPTSKDGSHAALRCLRSVLPGAKPWKGRLQQQSPQSWLIF